MGRTLICINVFKKNHIIVIIHIKICWKSWKPNHFSYMKIPHILCVAYHKFNGVHHCFIMKVKEILNIFFMFMPWIWLWLHVWLLFWHILPCFHLELGSLSWKAMALICFIMRNGPNIWWSNFYNGFVVKICCHWSQT